MKLPKNKFLLSLLVLTILGFILRIYALSTQSIWMDESFSMNAAYETLEKGYPLLDSGAFYGISYLLHTYLISFFMLIFNDVFGARLVSVIFGVLTIVLSYYFGKKFFNKELSFLLALIIGVYYLINYNYVNIVYFTQYHLYLRNIHFPYFYLGILGLILSLKEFRKGSLLLLSFLIPFLFVSYLVLLIHFRYLFFFLPILFLSSLYVLDYNPTRRTNGTIKSGENSGTDRYTNKEVLDLNKFEDILPKRRGYVLVDRFSLGRMSK